MNLKEIFKGNQNAKDKYVTFLKNQTSFSSGASRITNGRYTLKRLKMEPGDAMVVFPLMIHLPIGYDGTKLEEPMPYVGSYDTSIGLIKTLAVQDSTFKEGLAEILDEDFKVLNLETPEASEQERKVFWRFRRPLVYQKTVMAVKPANSPYQYGTPYAVNIATDPDTHNYIDHVDNPLIWTLYKLESACIASQVKELRETNEAAGDARRTEKSIQDQTSDMWKNRVISPPYSLGTTRVLFFKTNNNHEILDNVVKGWSPDIGGIRSNEYYIKINRKIIEKLDNIIGSKFDRYADFLLVVQNTPNFTEKDRGTAAQSISRMGASSDDKIEDMLKDFISAYTDYRDNMDAWDEKVIKSSAYEYRAISDENISKIFKESIGTLSAALRTQEIFDKFGETITKIDSEFSNELMSSALNGELKSVGDITSELAAAPKITEDTPGYGGDEAMAAESDSQAMMDALTSN